MRIMRIHFQQFINQRPIIDHRLPHFFRAGFAALPAHGELASGTVVLDDDWVIHGQIGGTPIELFKGIAARRHHLRDELIGFADCAVRIVHETRLNAAPFTRKRGGLFMSELVQVETTDAVGALPQNRIRTRGTNSLNGSFVLRPELFAQVAPLPTARIPPDCKHEQHDSHTNPDNHEGL